MKRIKTNAMIFVVAVLLSVVLFYTTKNPDLFSASILSLQDAETIKAKSRDVGYKNEGNILDTFLSDKLQNISNITFSIIYDKENINLNLEKFDSQTEYEILSSQEGSFVVKFTNFSGIDYDYQKSLFELPFDGEMQNVLISEGMANLFNGENKNLSIGLLNSDDVDYHQSFN
ncbi:MAG TPA: hypothetical protein VJ892_03950 [Candidatus Absconditabacterales bacterium]|nr:hypothetical protein [Candidatus Absconditabacterales bacterium]